MTRYIVRRLLGMIVVLTLIAVIVFVAMRLIPGDPAVLYAGINATDEDVALVRKSMGLDKSYPEQFLIFVENTVRGDFGTSLRNQRPVAGEIGKRLPASLLLASTSILLATLIGLPLGVLAAVNRGKVMDMLAMLLSIAGICMPTFWLGLLLITLFTVKLGWFPSSGWDGPKYLVLPSVTLGAYSMATVARITRSSMLDVLRHDYVRTARAKGLRENRVILAHGLRNALVPIIAVTSLQFGYLLGASVVTETVFAWPGIGLLLIDGINNRDYPVVQTTVLLIGAMFAVINLAADLIYAWADPRIRYA